MSAKPIKIELDIVMNATQTPDRDISPATFAGTLESIICSAVQSRLPNCEIEVRTLKANWPGAKDSFPGFDIREDNEKRIV